MGSIANTLRQMRNPSSARVITRKVARRLTPREGSLSYDENLAWLVTHQLDFETLARRLDADLWRESQEVERSLLDLGSRRMASLPVTLGGAGYLSCLYFLARHTQPNVVVETGVAAGFSSAAILRALDANGNGLLFSSDFPYFRIRDPLQYIGVVVDPELKDKWTLYAEGDGRNLPKILSQVGDVDLFHYDSDKTYYGREHAISLISPRLPLKAVVMMDDIQDNSFFHDWVSHAGLPWVVVPWMDKYIGIAGTPLEAAMRS